MTPEALRARSTKASLRLNIIGESEPLTGKRVLLDDETLRDGLQSPTVSDPAIEDKIQLLHLMEELGIQMLDIGLPGAVPRAYADTLALAKEIARSRLKIRPNCAARTTIQDITRYWTLPTRAE